MTTEIRYIWTHYNGTEYHAQGTPSREPNGDVRITAANGTIIRSVERPVTTPRPKNEWHLEITYPDGTVKTVGPIMGGKQIPVRTSETPEVPPGCVRDLGTVTISDNARYARFVDAEREDALFDARCEAAIDLTNIENL